MRPRAGKTAWVKRKRQQFHRGGLDAHMQGGKEKGRPKKKGGCTIKVITRIHAKRMIVCFPYARELVLYHECIYEFVVRICSKVGKSESFKGRVVRGKSGSDARD
jgi:hypothetical protein